MIHKCHYKEVYIKS